MQIELATVRVYLKVLEEMTKDPDTAPWANECIRELCHPVNNIEEFFRPIIEGKDCSVNEQILRFRVRQLIRKNNGG